MGGIVLDPPQRIELVRNDSQLFSWLSSARLSMTHALQAIRLGVNLVFTRVGSLAVKDGMTYISCLTRFDLHYYLSVEYCRLVEATGCRSVLRDL